MEKTKLHHHHTTIPLQDFRNAGKKYALPLGHELNSRGVAQGNHRELVSIQRCIIKFKKR